MTGLPIFYLLEGGLCPVLQFKRVLLPSSKNSKGYPFITLKKKKKTQEGENNKNNFKPGGVLNQDQHCKSTKFGNVYWDSQCLCEYFQSVSQESDHQIWNPGDHA